MVVGVVTIRQTLGRGRAAIRRLRGSELDHVIPGEIKDDQFYDAIIRVARSSGLTDILEIGASSGAGSTEAFVKGISQNPERPTLHCLEVSAPRYEALVTRYRDVSFVRCYHASSVALDDFPTAETVEAAIRTHDLAFGPADLNEVLRWRRQDIDYITDHQVPQSGIRAIKVENGITTFDAVLIDGSEFTGSAELAEVHGARFMLLDDIRTYKNHANYRALLDDAAYTLVEAQPELRNGYAVFELRHP